jgi:hypothetical protein
MAAGACTIFQMKKHRKKKSNDPTERLFEATSDDVSTLHRQARKELRLKARKEWKEKQNGY